MPNANDPLCALKFEQGAIAHRGANQKAPENTLAAFRKAQELGMQWVEFDVMLSNDNVPVVIHDDTLERTTNGHGYIDEYSYDELKKLDAGSWFSAAFAGERIPSLYEVIAFLSEKAMSANIEIKALHGDDERNVIRSLAVIQKLGKSPDDPMFMFSSFSLDSLRCLRDLAPKAKRGFLLHEWRDDWLDVCRELGCISMNVNHEIMTPVWAAQIKAQGLTLLCYTVNTLERANELRSWGVDAVFSDAPDVTRRPAPEVEEAPVSRSYCRIS